MLFGQWKAFKETSKWQHVPSRSSSEDDASESFIPQKKEYQSSPPTRNCRFIFPSLVVSNIVTLGIAIYLGISSPFLGHSMNAALKATSYYCEYAIEGYASAS
jgi:hypothetical protein